MLRGYIEQVTPELISGWLYAEHAPVNGRIVLAMLDGVAIATGKVQFFRQDLADAGLGDGNLGFHFPLPGVAPRDLRRVTIRIEGSDADLLQRDARLEGEPAEAPVAAAPAGVPGAAPAPVAPGLPVLPDAAVRWMRGRGWLDAQEADALIALRRFGVADWTLAAGTAREAAVDSLLGLIALQRVGTDRRELATLEDVAGLCARMAKAEDAAQIPVIALWCATPGRLGVAEASHLEPEPEEGAGAEALTDYEFGPDRLLLLHAASRFQPRPRSGRDRIEVTIARVLPEERTGRVVIGPARR